MQVGAPGLAAEQSHPAVTLSATPVAAKAIPRGEQVAEGGLNNELIVTARLQELPETARPQSRQPSCRASPPPCRGWWRALDTHQGWRQPSERHGGTPHAGSSKGCSCLHCLASSFCEPKHSRPLHENPGPAWRKATSWLKQPCTTPCAFLEQNSQLKHPDTFTEEDVGTSTKPSVNTELASPGSRPHGWCATRRDDTFGASLPGDPQE